MQRRDAMTRPAATAERGAEVARATDLRSYDGFQSSAYFPALDGLRAISILLVLAHHLPRFESPLLQIMQENGRYGVSFFFAISGFLICTLLLREQRENGRISLTKFYSRRSLRLFPLYYAVLAFQAVLVFGTHFHSAMGVELFREKLPAYLFYYSNLLPTATDGPFFFAWSLAAEEQFYLCASLLLFLLPRGAMLAVTIAALVTKFVVFNTWGNVDANSQLWRVVFSYQEPILWGVLLAFALDSRRWFDALRRMLESRFVVPGCALLGTFWLLTHPFSSQSQWDAEVLYLLMTLVLAGFALRRSPTPLGRGLPAHVGKISYGIYLLHYYVIVAVTKLVPGGNNPVICAVACLLILVPLASVVYRYFERPLIDYGRSRFRARRMPVRPAETLAAAGAPPAPDVSAQAISDQRTPTLANPVVPATETP